MHYPTLLLTILTALPLTFAHSHSHNHNNGLHQRSHRHHHSNSKKELDQAAGAPPSWPAEAVGSHYDGDIWRKRQVSENGEAVAWPEAVTVDHSQAIQKRSTEEVVEEEEPYVPKPPPGAKVYTTQITPGSFHGNDFNQANAGAGYGNSSEEIREMEKRAIAEKRAFSGMRATYYVVSIK